ncbi:MAG: hypothetical protein HY676_06210 [Chloroflexi bacterium]|nr:hypothetical protein [Chloroflexota bacterium]
MRRLWSLFMDLVFLAILIAVIVALWGLRSTNSQEDIPATVRVSKGQVSIVDTATKAEYKGSGVLNLNVGQELRLDAGGDAFVFYADGSISRLTGPAGLNLAESRRTIKKPAILTSVSGKLFHKPPPPPAETLIAVTAQVLKGDVITRTTPSSNTSHFEIRGSGVIVSPKAADQGKISFAITVPESGDVSIEVGQGQVAVGMISLVEGKAVPVVVPLLASKQGIMVPAMPADKVNSSDVTRLIEKVAPAIPALKSGSGPVTAEGIDFKEVTTADIAYFVAERLDGEPLAPPPDVVTQNVTDTTVITEKVITPGTFDIIITDQSIADSIPAGFPGDPKVHILPGSVVQVEYWGMTLICSIDIVHGRAQFNGLPLGIDPPQIEKAIKDALGTDELPTLLSIVSSDGKATVSYTKDIITTRTTTVENEVAIPESLPHTSTYFRSIPTPREISTDWKVVGSNALLALLVTFVVSVLAGWVNSFVGGYEKHFARAYNPFVKAGRGVWKGLSIVGRALRWFSPGPLTRGVWMMFVFGAVYSLLAVGKGLLGPNGLTLLLTLSFTTGFMALYTPWIKSFIARRMKLDARVGLRPGQLGVAIVSVGISRGLAFKPGLILGSPGGLKMGEKSLTQRQKAILDALSLVALGVLAAGAWVLVLFLPQIGAQSWAAGFFKTARGFVSGLQDWGLAVFAVAVQTVFIGLLPWPKSFGANMLKKMMIIWALAFATSSFVFIHTMLNKQKTIMDLTTNMIVTLVVVVVLALLAFGYKWRKGKSQPKGHESVTPAA